MLQVPVGIYYISSFRSGAGEALVKQWEVGGG